MRLAIFWTGYYALSLVGTGNALLGLVSSVSGVTDMGIVLVHDGFFFALLYLNCQGKRG